MWRSILFIKTAILISQPSMPSATATAYASILQAEGKARKFDPITVVAMVEGESHWNSRLVGGLNNQCVGLGQHCLHVYKYCTTTGYKGKRCQARRAYLLNGGNNLRETAKAITLWRKYCRKLTGRSALFARWLYGYQGHAWKNKNKQCGMAARNAAGGTFRGRRWFAE
jgi:hypothetical protein